MTVGGTLVIGCGASAKELLDVVTLNGLEGFTVECLPATLHNRPEKVTGAVADRIACARDSYDRILVGYGDCGTGGDLDRLIEAEGVERLPGAHCYEFYATTPVFSVIQDADPRTFYLTDYLVRHFDRLMIRGLGLDRHPELLDAYFGNYRRVVHLAQHEDSALEDEARRAAERLGLEYERILVGYGTLETALVELGSRDGSAHHYFVA